jgi:hypothetical protein
LLVALIPGLLMVATFGLQRIESGLNPDTVSATDVAKFLDQAEAVDVDTLARDGMGRALERLNQRLHDRDLAFEHIDGRGNTRLPTPVCDDRGANPEYQRTPYAYRV